MLKSIEETKSDLRDKSIRGELTGIQKHEFDFLRNRGATYLLHSAIAQSIETIIDNPAPDKFRISFTRDVTPSKAIDLWKPIVEATIPFYATLVPGVSGSIQKKTEVDSAISVFHSMIEATKRSNEGIFKEFTRKIQIN